MNQLRQMENTKDSIDAYMQFDLGSECYAIGLLSVKEVIPIPETTKLPNCPAHFTGIMNLRGQIISIIDLRKRLKINPKKEDLQEAVIIVEFQGIAIGVIVDAINRVLNLGDADIAPLPEMKSQVNAQYIQGVYQSEKNLIMLLDLESILDIQTIKKLQRKEA